VYQLKYELQIKHFFYTDIVLKLVADNFHYVNMTTETKHFTPSEARKTLPLVKKIVKDILDTSREMRLVADEIGFMSGQSEITGESDPRLKKMVDEIEEFMKELEDIGCYFKDWNFTIGLVDFPSVIDGEEVFLCWKSDEDDILYYHKIESGYAGRKPIPEEYFGEK